MDQTAASKLLKHLKLPIICAPMFLVSSPQLVIEACKAGVIGSFPLLNARSSTVLEEWMKQISREVALAKNENQSKKIAPWAVNLIVHHTNKRFDSDMKMIRNYRPPIVITSLGNPSSVVSIVHEYGGLVLADVSTLKHAKKAAQSGVDGLILVCSGAGGHAGTYNPMAFIHAVREFWDGLLILAGSISTGRDILAAEVLGADLAYMGTRFIPTTEAFANKAYQQMIVDSTIEDIVYTDAFSGIKANYLIPSIEKNGLNPNHLQKKELIDFSSMTNPKIKAWKDIWSAGQGISSIKTIAPIAQVINELTEQYEQELLKMKKRHPF
ncbi:NAD(P)H-dependent flavin oxidoreductase [Anaerobacillus sp. MEB173]|uniref:NAD(P)H-dependent flavin oxidoreductase n=1 Tax=Anaerobacillus sp. MEB173 TaxID=3383345 RepID=UPI003F901605